MANAYQEMLNRAKQDAEELIKDSVSFAKAKAINTFDGWADYINALESLELSVMADSCADSWDTVIYHYKALQLCIDCPSSVLSEAESASEDFGGDPVGLYELASRIAYFIVTQAISEALQDEVDGYIELAESLQENFQ